MGSQRAFLALHEMVRVVLHEGRGSVSVLSHCLDDCRHGADLPVSLCAVAVALGHQVLGCKARQLLHAVEVLEGVGEGLATVSVHHLLHGDLFAGLIADGGDVLGVDVVVLLVFSKELVYFGLGDCGHLLDQISDRPGVDLPAELDLGFDLVAFGDRDFSHVVAEAHDLHGIGNTDSDTDAHPLGNALLDLRILPVAGYDLARHAHPGSDETVFTVAVGCLVEVHEIHVDLLVGDLQVVLCGKVAVRLLQIGEAVDPHLRWAECMAPGYDSVAAVIVVGFLDDIRNLAVAHCSDFVDQRIGKCLGKLCRHFLCSLCDCPEDFIPIQVLASDYEPEFLLHDFTSCP